MNMTASSLMQYHLQYNHYPPLPRVLVNVALDAVTEAVDGEWEQEIPMPEGLTFRGRDSITVSEAVEAFHLDGWIQARMQEEEFDAV